LVAAALVFVLWPTPVADGIGTWMVAAGVEPRYETIDGLRVRYVRKGEGAPVVLVHGIASSLYTWKDVLPALATGHDVIAMDLPGFGDSAIPESLDGEQAVRSVLALVDHLGIPRASWVGHSLGGAIAVAIAARAPARVDRLVLIDAAGYNFDPADRPWVLRLASALPAPVADALPVRPLVILALRQVFHDDSLVTPRRVAEYVLPLQRPGATAALRRLLNSGGDLGFPDVIRRVAVPTLVIWGRYDTWIPMRDAQRFAADVRDARVAFVEAGHMPQEERPVETARLVMEFVGGRLQSQGGHSRDNPKGVRDPP
jgi:pimeloyl-ACP methyl ester carboxylesterase